MPRRLAGGAASAPAEKRHLDQRRQHAAALGGGAGLEQRLFFLRLERTDHGERGDERRVGGALDLLPVGLDALLLEEALKRAQEPSAIELERLILVLVLRELSVLRLLTTLAG
jgi:hypothetical protein